MEVAKSEARTVCDWNEGNEVRAVCEWSEGGAKRSPDPDASGEGGLRLLLAARVLASFLFLGRVSESGQKG